MDQSAHNNHSNMLNPNNSSYWMSRGYPDKPENWEELIPNETMDQAALNNHSNMNNPNNSCYWKSRDYSTKPDNWVELLAGNAGADSDSAQGGHSWFKFAFDIITQFVPIIMNLVNRGEGDENN